MNGRGREENQVDLEKEEQSRKNQKNGQSGLKGHAVEAF